MIGVLVSDNDSRKFGGLLANRLESLAYFAARHARIYENASA
jgi:hypothetical protein